MGGLQTKEKCSIASEIAMESLKTKVNILQEEIQEIMCIRDAENQAYEREKMVFALKEMEWKKEKKKMKEEVKKLKKRLESGRDQENSIENNMVVEDEKRHKVLDVLEVLKILELRKEQARRDEAAEKWKQLYFAIKMELDDLIQRSYQGERVSWKTEEEVMLEEVQKELKAKEETIQHLQAQVAGMKQEEYKRERELDILRQSLRILCFNKKQRAFRVKNTPEAACTCCMNKEI